MDFHSDRTLYHEAGHAVIARRMGVGVCSITVQGTEEYLGLVRHYPVGKWFRPDIEWSARVADKIDKHVRIALAGMSAETHWAKTLDRLPRRWKHHIRQGAQHDIESAEDLAMYRAAPNAADAYLDWMQAEVDAALENPQRWSEVEAVVAALREKPTLTSRELRTAIDSASRFKRLQQDI